MTQLLSPHLSIPGGLKVGFAGHEENHQALLRGDLHLYADYVGTALHRYLKLPPLPRAQVYPAVREAAWHRWNVRWLEPVGFDNTYGLLMPAARADYLGLDAISDLAVRAVDLTLGASDRFLLNEPPLTFAPGGYPAFAAKYGFDFGRTSVIAPEYGETYAALARGAFDIIADFVVTPYVEAADLVALTDDLGFFAAYYLAPVVRGDFLEQYPRAKPLLEQLAWTIDNRTMARLNYKMEFAGHDPAELAKEFLASLG